MSSIRAQRRRILSAGLSAGVVLLLAGAVPAAPAGLKPCYGQPGFVCGVLDVPRDRARPGAGTLHLRFAIQSTAAQRRKPLLIALSGGPGQAGAAFASSFAFSLDPLLGQYRLATIDQRGTGQSGALDCPRLQRPTIAAPPPADFAACADRLGRPRDAFSTRDTVADLDALRVRLRQTKIALMGVSYGTFVAQQYARLHPASTRALILDSVVGASPDPFLLDSYRAVPRIVRSQCSAGACRGVTADPVADLGQAAARINAGGMRGTTYDAGGMAHTTRLTHGDELIYLLVEGDLNPVLRAAVPGAVRSAVGGDTAPLMRLVEIAAGPGAGRTDFSGGLYAATTCSDLPGPYPLTAGAAERDATTATAFAEIPPADYAPFSAADILRPSNAVACSRWPTAHLPPPSQAPLPDVPALILAGRLDIRTPFENAALIARELPQAQFVRLAGTGHDVLDSDYTGCAARAAERWAAGRSAGTRCRGLTNLAPVLPRPPRTLGAVGRAAGVPGLRGRAVAAVVETVADARIGVLLRDFAGLPERGGGLRGGFFAARDLKPDTRGARLVLSRYMYVPGLRVSGVFQSRRGLVTGRASVRGLGVDGVLRLSRDGSVRGHLAGRSVASPSANTRADIRAASGRPAPSLAAVVARLPFSAHPRRPRP